MTAVSGGFGSGENTGTDALTRHAARLARYLIEVLDGRRDARLLDDYVTQGVALRIRRWARRPGSLPTPGGRARLRGAAPRLVTIHSARLSGDALEAAVVFEQGGWLRSIAVRLDHRQGIWRASELAPPECGLDAMPFVPRLTMTPRPDAFDETEGRERDGRVEREDSDRSAHPSGTGQPEDRPD